MKADNRQIAIPKVADVLKRKVGYGMEDEVVKEARKQLKNMTVSDKQGEPMEQ